MEARVLTRYFLLVHLAFTLINGHPILNSLYILGNDTVNVDLRATKNQQDTQETRFLLKTTLDVKDLHDIVQIIAERHRYKMDADYVTSIHWYNLFSKKDYVDKNDEDLVSDSEYSQISQVQIENWIKNNITLKNQSAGNSYQGEVNSGKMKRNSSLPPLYCRNMLLNKINGRLRKDEKSGKIQSYRRDYRRRLEIMLIDEIHNLTREALSLVETRPERKKKKVKDFSNIIEEDSQSYHKKVTDELLNLYVDTRILYRKILKDLALRNERQRMISNDRSSSYDYWNRPRPSFKHDSSDRYYLQNFVDWLKRNQKLDNPTVYDEITAKQIFENFKKNDTPLKDGTTGTLKVDPAKSAYEKLIDLTYKQDVVTNETAVGFGFDNLWNFTSKQSNKESYFSNSRKNNTLVSKRHSSHHQADSKGDTKFWKELKNNTKNGWEDTKKIFKIIKETSIKEITKGEDIRDSNGKNVSISLLPKINGTADEGGDMKNNTIIHIKDISNNVIKNLTKTNEFLKPPNPTVATTNTKQNGPFLIQNEKFKESKENNEQNQFVMDHILDAVDNVFLFN